ncbi:ABC transporter ATP-binding protein [candidate division WWE3 bacterium]|uniref:ABC transporter ATP-binding protein n=1 Tax=candidate division WWE3 bacterium TaxID=2053526 RepID=A0A955LJN4_UNCKA|nr:ABC transporter ATP-binding protein [candidate division WWE3 bacterium]
MASDSPIISLKNVSKEYQVGDFEVTALDDVSLEVTSGEFIIILGPSGSGKTTLLNVIGGLDSPTDGTVVVNGNEIQNLKDKELTEFRRHNIGFIFQFFNLLPTLSAEENIALVDELTSDEELKPQDMIDAVGLLERKDHFPSQLSGGEQQRIAIARALVKNTPIMLCDEPTGELDFETGIKILKLLRRLNKEYKKTFLIVTHNAALAPIADRVIKLRSGKITDDERNENPIDPENVSW